MPILPKSLETLIEELGTLPGVGPRSAERFAFHLLKSSKAQAGQLANALSQLHDSIKICPKTFMLIDTVLDLSPLYTDLSRSKQQVAVVEEPFDVVAIEKTTAFRGTYHVLGGAISPIDGIGPQDLHIEELIQRIKYDKVKEIILATNASVEGESTALYLQKQLKQIKGVKITRLARGLPAGVDIEYADQITLTRALEGRQNL
jgi:recombination protein RecR